MLTAKRCTMDIRIKFEKQPQGDYLATVRLLTDERVIFHRVKLPPDSRPWATCSELAAQALRYIRSSGGPDAQVVTMQAALPV